MNKLLYTIFTLLSLSIGAHKTNTRTMFSTTWYIRHDGGTNVQCTGTTNAAYPGSGTGLPCAYRHPFELMSYFGAYPGLAANDTIQFTDPPTNTVPYYMGEQNGGVGIDWGGSGGSGPLGGICPAPNTGYPGGASCMLSVMPDGVHIIGQNAGNCHTPGHTGLVNPTILSGISGIFGVLDFQGTNNISISCLEITQPDNCTTQGVGSGGGCSSTANYISFGGIVLAYQLAQGPRNMIMTDIAVDGTAAAGILGMHINTMPSDVMTVNDLYLIGNGGVGWNADGTGCNGAHANDCESVGTLNATNMDVEGNGCLLLKPFDVSLGLVGGSNAFSYCFGQNDGGYGDGFVIIASGDFTVNVTQGTFKYNTQDGFDALHISDDVTTNPIVTINQSWSEGNGGQAYKLGAGASASAINNVAIVNCHILTQSTSFPNNPGGWITLDYGDSCRAAGNQWAFQMKNGSTLLLENNTTVGYGTTMYDFGCASLAPNCGTSSPQASVIFINNLNMGQPDPGNSGRLASGWYLEPGTQASNITATYNLWYNMFAASGCPDSVLTGESNYVCGNPMLVAQSNPDAINPNLTSGSAAINAGSSSVCPDVDYYNSVRTGANCTIGAIVYNGLPSWSTTKIFRAPHL